MEIQIPKLKDLTVDDFTSTEAWVSFKFERERISEEEEILARRQERMDRWERELMTRTKINIALCIIAVVIALLR